MEIDIQYRPSYSLVIVKLAAGERIRAETGAMVSMSPDVSIETRAAGGMLRSLSRAVLGSESFFQNYFQAGPQGGEVTLAPRLPGDVALIELKDSDKVMVQAVSYLASETGLEINAKISMKAFMSAEGISMLEVSGAGKLLVCSYGAIYERKIEKDEKYVVDSSHLVAFDASLSAAARMAGGLRTSLLSGEGLVVELSGAGRIFIQTRSPQALISWIAPQIPPQKTN